MSTETITENTDAMSTETISPERRRPHWLLVAIPVVAGILMLAAFWPTMEWREQQRAQAEQEQRLAEEASFGQVQGVVMLDGQPLGTVEVAFLPDPTQGTRGATANCYTDGQGRFTLRTEKEDRNGALVGHHRVVINDIAALPGPGGPKPKNRVPSDYSDPFRTPLRLEVRPGSQTINLEVVTPTLEESKQ